MARIAVVLVFVLTLAACSGAESGVDAPVSDAEPSAAEPAASTPAPAASAPTPGASAAAAADTVTVTALEYEYRDVPDPVPVGSTIALDNQGEQPHEVVAFRIPDGEDRSLQDLLALPDEEAEQAVEFMGVAVALTDGPTHYPAGPFTLDEPGRYAFVCFLPVGITDADLEGPLAEGGSEEPVLPEGAPHFTRGMATEVTVG